MHIGLNCARSRGLPGLLDLFLGARDGVTELVCLGGGRIHLSFFSIVEGSPSSRRVEQPFLFIFIQKVLERLCRGHRRTYFIGALFNNNNYVHDFMNINIGAFIFYLIYYIIDLWLSLELSCLAQKNLIWYRLACHLIEHIFYDLIDVVSLPSSIEKLLCS